MIKSFYLKFFFFIEYIFFIYIFNQNQVHLHMYHSHPLHFSHKNKYNLLMLKKICSINLHYIEL
jgi:hypothetical protein